MDSGRISVRRSWDPREGAVEPKSRAGTRSVPIVAALRVPQLQGVIYDECVDSILRKRAEPGESLAA